MKRLLVLAMLLTALAMGAKAMMIALPDEEYVGTADAIIVGTVLDDARMNPAREWLTGRATVRVDQVLKGAPAKTVIVYHSAPPQTPPGTMIMDHGGFMLAPQTQHLFFLYRLQDGYSLVNGMQGRRDVAEVARFQQLITAIPVQLTMALPPATSFYFGQPAPVTIIASNRGNTAIEIRNPSLESYFVSPRMGLTMQLRVQPEQANAAPTANGAVFGMPMQQQPITVEPGKTVNLTLNVTSDKPASWQVFTPDTYLLTPITLRARVYIMPIAGNNRLAGYSVATPWQQVLVGFPPPAE